jgi:hypothetical protein
LPLSNKHSNDGTENTELAPARKQQKPKPSLSIHNTSIQRIRYSIRRPLRKGNSSTWPSDKQSNIHDPSSPLEAGLGIASEVDMAGEVGIAPEGEGNILVVVVADRTFCLE